MVVMMMVVVVLCSIVVRVLVCLRSDRLLHCGSRGFSQSNGKYMQIRDRVDDYNTIRESGREL